MIGKVLPTLFIAGAGLALLFSPARAASEEWGTIKGQVVFGGKVIPEPKKIDASTNQDKQHCLSKGPLFSDEWVINPQNKGVRWVFVWLAPAASGAALPVHPSLKEIKQKEVTIDQPCCMFVPHALAIRQGQDILAKNSSPVSHNINWTGFKNPGNNILLPSGSSLKITKLVPDRVPLKLSCNIHSWMSGWVRIFDHPYFAVTDDNGMFEIKLAPAGNYRLVTWQEAVGYGPGLRQGVPIAIKGGAETNAGKIELKPADSK
jgi:hypothetical protein